MKLKAPSKDCLIYRVVSWLNCKIIGDDCKPNTSCQLGWYSILWTVVFVNIVAFFVAPINIVFYDGTLAECLFHNITCAGAFVGTIVLLWSMLLWFIVTSGFFITITILYVSLCFMYLLLKGTTYLTEDDSYSKNPLTKQFWQQGFMLLCSLSNMGYEECKEPIKKLLNKIKIDCEEIK